jgi:hypothetical protein
MASDVVVDLFKHNFLVTDKATYMELSLFDSTMNLYCKYATQLQDGVRSSLKNEEQYYVESQGITHNSIHTYNNCRIMHQKNREDANLTYESLINLQE